MTTPLSETPVPKELVNAALSGEPFNMPVDYQALPDSPSREEVVAVRLAKNVGPLFGVPNPNGPFKEMSWLSNYDELRLAEIGRGARGSLKPSREVITQMKAQGIIDNSDERGIENTPGYVVFERYVYGKTPNDIVRATLNTFGPNVKAAVTLTGINYLFRPQTHTLTEAIRSETFQGLRPDQKMRAYGAMVFGVYRPQPSLFIAGMIARNIQRASLPLWVPSAPHLEGRPLADSEVRAIYERDEQDDHGPTNLAVIDDTMQSVIESLPADSFPTNLDIKTILVDGLIKVLKKVTALEEYYNPLTERHTAYATIAPSMIASAFLNLTPFKHE